MNAKAAQVPGEGVEHIRIRFAGAAASRTHNAQGKRTATELGCPGVFRIGSTGLGAVDDKLRPVYGGELIVFAEVNGILGATAFAIFTKQASPHVERQASAFFA